MQCCKKQLEFYDTKEPHKEISSLLGKIASVYTELRCNEHSLVKILGRLLDSCPEARNTFWDYNQMGPMIEHLVIQFRL